MSEKKAILISVRPKYVELIANGSKTIEVRKTRPKTETPFKVYIYCTYGKANENYMLGKRGKVIGHFTCDKVLEWKYLNGLNDENEKEYWIISKDGHATCLTYDEIEEYGKGKTLYGWHISDLKIYDKTRELSEFQKAQYDYGKIHIPPREMKRPFQSWGYCESLGE